MKQLIRQIGLMLAVILVAISCQPEKLEDLTNEDPVFYLSGVIDGQHFEWNAGVDGYFMFPYVAQSGIYESYAGVLQVPCEQLHCPEGIEITFFDSSGSSGIIPQELLETGDRSFVNSYDPPSQREYRLTFSAGDQVDEPAGYFWSIDGTEYTGPEQEVWLTGDEHFICLTTISGPNYCLSEVCKTINLSTQQQCTIDLEFTMETPQSFVVEAMGSGPDVFSVEWNQPGASGDAIFIDQSGAGYICATMLDGENCVALICSQVLLVDSVLQICMSDFTYGIQEIREEEDQYHNRVLVVYTDGDGISYRSDQAMQLASYFSVISAESYSDRFENEAVKIDLSFQADLKNGSGDLIRLAGVEGSFAIGWK